jgi:hypothetical protein
VSNAQAPPQHGQLHASKAASFALIAFGSRRAGLIFCIRSWKLSLSLCMHVSGPALIPCSLAGTQPLSSSPPLLSLSLCVCVGVCKVKFPPRVWPASSAKSPSCSRVKKPARVLSRIHCTFFWARAITPRNAREMCARLGQICRLNCWLAANCCYVNVATWKAS